MLTSAVSILNSLGGRYQTKVTTMKSGTSQPLISTDSVDFIEKVETRIKQGEPIVILLRYNNQNRKRACFLVRTIDEFQQVLHKTHPRDALSVFFRQSFFAEGTASHEIKDRIMFLGKFVPEEDDSIVVIRTDINNFILDADTMKNFFTREEADEWFSQYLGVPIIVALLTYWADNSEEITTAYVRDSDGQLRPGVY